MFSKFSVALAVGLVPFLATANPLLVAKDDAYYPPGMPSECIPYYTPPTTCTAVPVMPAYPATPASVPYAPTPVSKPPVYMSSSSSSSVYSTPAHSPPPAPVYSTHSTPPVYPNHSTPPVYPTHSTPPVYSKSKAPPPAPTVTITPTPPAATHISQCNTGSAQCCNSVHKASDSSAAGPLGIVGVVLDSTDVLVGLGCTPLNVVGASGVNCAQSPVCCSNNNFNGLVNIACSPISL